MPQATLESVGHKSLIDAHERLTQLLADTIADAEAADAWSAKTPLFHLCDTLWDARAALDRAIETM